MKNIKNLKARWRMPDLRVLLCTLLLAALAACPTLAVDTPPGATKAIEITSSAPDAMWTPMGTAATASGVPFTDRDNLPSTYHLAGLEYSAMTDRLARAPHERDKALVGTEITLPMPDGTFQRFQVFETEIMGPEVQALVPDKRTYVAKGIDDPTAVIHLDTGYFGLRAYGRTAQGTLWIDPWQMGDKSVVISAWTRDFTASGEAWECGVPEGQPDLPIPTAKALPTSGDLLYTYRLSMCLTGEYTTFFGGQTPAVDASVTTINRVNSVYEVDVAVRFLYQNVAPYTDPATDPFPTGTVVDGNLLAQNHATLDALIGNGAYDIGHIFTQASGGLAYRPSVCNNTYKGYGGTGRPNPVGDPFDIDYVAHEIGHQMGGSHTFNGSTGSCAGSNRSASNAYEPGSGTTIMAYAGICGAENVQVNSDPYFHVRSLEQIIAVRNATCGVTYATGNTPPTINAGPDRNLPRGTTFYLSAEGNDVDGDALTYNFEQYDLGNASPPTDPYGPLFRSYGPNGAYWRYFTDNPAAYLNLPTVDRSLTFRAIVRDNAASGGGVADDEIELTVSGAPFEVTYPAGGEGFTAGQKVTVQWNVGGSVATEIRIGLTYPGNFTWFSGPTPNDGSEVVTIPCGVTETACKIWIEEVVPYTYGVHIYDQSEGEFAITDGLPDFRPWNAPSGWGDGVVPSPTATQSSTSAPLPTSLVGDGTSYFAFARGNFGAATGCVDLVSRLMLDETMVVEIPFNLPNGIGAVNTNLGSNVTGGRHTVWQTNDPDNLAPETDDTNNDYARQWVWEPAFLNQESVVQRAQPPEPFAGAPHIPGGTTYYPNADGLNLDLDLVPWQVVAISGLNGADNDLFLHPESTGPEDGFAGFGASSEYSGADTDFVLINYNVAVGDPFDVGIQRMGGSGDYVADRRFSGDGYSLGTQLTGVPVDGSQVVDIQEIWIGGAELGRNVIEISNVSTPQPCEVYLYDSGLTLGSRADFIAHASVDLDGRAIIDHDFTNSGYHAVVIVRRAVDGLDPFTYDFRFRATPADLAWAVVPGSHGPIVAIEYGTGPAYGDPVPAPVILPGDVNNTEYRFDLTNAGPADAVGGWDAGVLLDGDYLGAAEWGDVIPGGTSNIISTGLFTVPVAGGRHTAGVFFDGADEIDEVYEDNNRIAEQFVWEPTQLAVGAFVARNGSPEPMGGWDDIPVGLTMEYNADGLRTPGFVTNGDNGFVGGFAVAPVSGSDVDVRVHPASTGALDGFAADLEFSGQAGNATEIVLFDLDGALPEGVPFDIGAHRTGGSGAYQAQAASSQFLYFDADGAPAQHFGPFNMASGELMGLFEFWTGNGSGLDVPVIVKLDQEGGDADLVLAVFGRTDPSGFYTVSETLPFGFADAFGPADDEEVELILPADQYFMVAVYKKNGDEVDKDSVYRIRFASPSVVDVPQSAPMAARISNHPNPFNPQTKIAFTMEKPGRASVRIYDVQGRLVRTLVEGDLAAGEHQRNWQGTDDNGSNVASGVYLALFEYPGGALSSRMVLLK